MEQTAVQSITWWDFKDGGWLNPPSGLLRRDISRKPVYDAMGKLIEGEWLTGTQQLRTDVAGTARLKVALGSYTLRAADTIRRFSWKKRFQILILSFNI